MPHPETGKAQKNQNLQAPEWLDQLVDEMYARMQEGQRPALAFLLEQLLKLQEISLLVAVGIDLEGRKEVLSFWTLQGRESKAFRVEVLQDLITRGVHRVLLFVTDNFRGLREVIAKLFPYAEHQLCLLHLERNLRAQLSTPAFKEARTWLKKVRYARDREEGREAFARLVERVAREQPGMTRELQAKEKGYLAFLGYPEEVRGHNLVESLNAGIERMRLELGGCFPSREALEVNLFIQIVNLQDRWWRKPVPAVQARSYELKQLFALRYELDEEEEAGITQFLG